jgi:hypothetical protein
MLYSWGNTTGDPEMYGGYLFDPKSAFASYKSDDLSERVGRLLVETDTQRRHAGYRDLNIYAIETGAIIPLLQAVKTVAYQDRLRFTKYDNGWILPQTFAVNACTTSSATARPSASISAARPPKRLQRTPRSRMPRGYCCSPINRSPARPS